MPAIRKALSTAAFLFIVAAGCSSGPAPAEVEKQVQTRVTELETRDVAVRSERLIHRGAVVGFYKARQGKPAWEEKEGKQIILAIRGVGADGLDPADYHMKAIEDLIQQRKEGTSAEVEGDLDVLLTDAVAGMVDHMKYGRVRPASVNPAWNMDPRDGAPPLEETLKKVQSSSDIGEAIEHSRPDHFIYKGLVKELAQMKNVVTMGGWPTVPAGPTIKPGGIDSRIQAVRKRLSVSGEFRGEPGKPGTDPNYYEPELVDAVKLYQARHRLEETGLVDKLTVASMNVPAAARAGQVRANLERARWVLSDLPDKFMLVNIPAFKAYLIQGGKNVWEARTQVGEEGKETPTFRALMRTVVLNPDWTVPHSIIVNELLPDGLASIRKKGLRFYDGSGNEVDPGSVDEGDLDRLSLKQPPGPKNALGRVKFLFPNKYAIYLHDTPSRHLFATNVRTFSHGCIRLENALDLAKTLLKPQGWDEERIQEAVAGGETENITLKDPFPVLIVYWTVSVGASGETRYAMDIYSQDTKLLTALDAPIRRA
jgi:L,D-transpeptidase YcbB